MKQLLATALALILLPLTAGADTIYFKDGMRLDVQKAWEEDGQIKCDMYGAVTSYPKEEIERIERDRSIDQDSEKDKESHFSTEAPAPDRSEAPPDIERGKSGEDEKEKELRRCEQPYQYIQRKVVIPVTLNGVVEASMALDTGASGMVIFYPLALKLGLFDKKNEASLTFAWGIGGIVPVFLSIVDSVQVKEIKDQFIPTVITETVPGGFDGLIGMDFLANYSCTVNTMKKVVVFEEHPQDSKMIAGHDEAWWRYNFKQFSSHRSNWKRIRDYLHEERKDREKRLKTDSERLRTLESSADDQYKEADKLFRKLNRYAMHNFVPMEWREYDY